MADVPGRLVTAAGPDHDGVIVPAGLTRPLARLAVIGARKLQEDSGGLPLAPGVAAVIAELARFTDEPGARSVSSAATGDWLSPAQAADVAQISSQHVTRLCRRGRLIARRVESEWQIDRASAEDYARSRKSA